TTLVGALDLTSPLATLSIASAAKDSLILKSGLTGNGRLDSESIDGDTIHDTADIRVIHDETNTFVSATSAPLIRSHPVDYGLAAYTLENRADGAWLVGGRDYSTAGAAVLHTTALSAQDYFAALEPLQRHASDLRDRAAAGAFRSSRLDAGNLWVQGRAVDTEVDRSSASLDFTQRTLGITAGVDAHYDLGDANLATGVFADTATTLRDFIGAADGRTVTIGAGLTALYARRDGLYVSALARFDTSSHTLDTHAPNNALSADYHTQSGGLALEAGWRLGRDSFSFLSLLPENLWLEPSLGLGYAKLAGATYTTESNRGNNIIDITLAGAKALQYRAALAAGYKLDENWNLLARLAYASVDASGGTVSSRNVATQRDGLRNVATLLDGARYEAAVGVTRRVGANGRIHLDYTYVAGDDYTRPYTLTLGYSHLW
ncbi:MAG: autotransporter outer membrane beta-barrel domain-containing protein, partial [Opitutaceae bacterium]|nr:autotransporter outer membrane beta-barrel domain-containing protein [Opitutaceae bacterium]